MMARRYLAILAVYGSSWAAEPVRFVESIAMSDVSDVSVPAVLTVASSAAELVAAPKEGATLVERLRVGDRVKVLQFLEGPERLRDCKAVPFDGCVFRTSVWVRARTAGGGTGYCSLSELHAPLDSRAVVQEARDLFPYADALNSSRSKTFHVQAKYLPETGGPSFLDRVGWQNVMAKVLSPTGELVASRRDLEFLVRQSGGSFSYEGTPRRVPKDATALPAVLQPMALNPPLTALVLYEDRAESLAISRTEAVAYASTDSRDNPDATPLRYRLPLEVKNAVGMLLLTTSAAHEVRQERIKVSTRLYSYKVTSTVVNIRVTAADLDGDGNADVVCYVMTETVPHCDPRTDECGARRAAMLVLQDGVWYVTGGTWMSQEGLEGY